MGSGEGIWFCLDWGKGDCSLQFPEGGRNGEEGAGLFSLVSSCRHVGVVQSCATGNSDLTLGNTSIQREWSNLRAGFLERWLMPQAR